MSGGTDGLVAHPLGQHPLHAAGGRKAGMQRVVVERTRRLDVGEQQGISTRALVAQTDARKVRLAARVVVVEVDEQGRDALPVALDLLPQSRRGRFLEVAMRLELLAGLVVQELRDLEVA